MARLERKQDARYLIMKYEPYIWAVYFTSIVIACILLMMTVQEIRLTGF